MLEAGRAEEKHFISIPSLGWELSLSRPLCQAAHCPGPTSVLQRSPSCHGRGRRQLAGQPQGRRWARAASWRQCEEPACCGGLPVCPHWAGQSPRSPSRAEGGLEGSLVVVGCGHRHHVVAAAGHVLVHHTRRGGLVPHPAKSLDLKDKASSLRVPTSPGTPLSFRICCASGPELPQAWGWGGRGRKQPGPSGHRLTPVLSGTHRPGC